MRDDRPPLLLLDVDGPLNPWAALTAKSFDPPKARRKLGEEPYDFVRHQITVSDGGSYPVLISERMGADLWELDTRAGGPLELVWATTWTDDANRLLSPLLGFQEDLPVIRWPDRHEIQARYNQLPHLGSWKTPYIAEWLVENRPMTPWAWLDDDIRRSDRKYFKEWYGEGLGPEHRLDQVYPQLGIRRLDVADLRDWAEAVSGKTTKKENRP